MRILQGPASKKDGAVQIDKVREHNLELQK